MNLPGEPTNDRRSVPRHIRDGEHDSWEDTLAGVPREQAVRTRMLRVLSYLAAALAAALGAWLALR
jgi:hypothetical protein